MDINRWSVPKQIDYILWSQRWRSSIELEKTRLGADCGSDHKVLIAKFRLKLKKVYIYISFNWWMAKESETGTSGVARCSQDWGHGTERMHGFPSIACYLKVKLFNHDPLTQDMDCLLALWRLLFPVIPLVMVVICFGFYSLLNFIFYLKLPCVTIYKCTQIWIKHPCSTRDLGPPCPSFSLWLVL